MTTRLTTRTVTFARPFILDDVGSELPAGAYVVETEEEAIDGVSFLAYRRVSTRLFVRRGGAAARMWTIHPDDLAFALAGDRAGATSAA